MSVETHLQGGRAGDPIPFEDLLRRQREKLAAENSGRVAEVFGVIILGFTTEKGLASAAALALPLPTPETPGREQIVADLRAFTADSVLERALEVALSVRHDARVAS